MRLRLRASAFSQTVLFYKEWYTFKKNIYPFVWGYYDLRVLLWEANIPSDSDIIKIVKRTYFILYKTPTQRWFF